MSKRTQRWAELTQRAQEMGQTLVVMLVQGEPQPGDQMTYSEITGPATSDLDAAMNRVEMYLDSPEASRVADLIAQRSMNRRRVELGIQRVTAAIDDLADVERQIAEVSQGSVADSVLARAADESRPDAFDAAAQEEVQASVPS